MSPHFLIVHPSTRYTMHRQTAAATSDVSTSGDVTDAAAAAARATVCGVCSLHVRLCTAGERRAGRGRVPTVSAAVGGGLFVQRGDAMMRRSAPWESNAVTAGGAAGNEL